MKDTVASAISSIRAENPSGEGASSRPDGQPHRPGQVHPFVIPRRDDNPVEAQADDPVGGRWARALELAQGLSERVRVSQTRTAELEARTERLVVQAYEDLCAERARAKAAEQLVRDMQVKYQAMEERAAGVEARAVAAEQMLHAALVRVETAEKRERESEGFLRVAEERAEALEKRAKQAERWLRRLSDALGANAVEAHRTVAKAA